MDPASEPNPLRCYCRQCGGSEAEGGTQMAEAGTPLGQLRGGYRQGIGTTVDRQSSPPIAPSTMSTRTEATEGQAKIKEALAAMRKHFGENDRTQYEHRMFSLADEALSLLDASPPIVGDPKEMDTERIIDIALVDLRVANGPGFVPSPYVLAVTSLRVARDHGYLAQAPQSSPAPGLTAEERSVLIDALYDCANRCETKPDIDAALEILRRSPAPHGVTVDQILEVVNDWRANMHLIEVPPNTPYSTGVQNVLRSRLSALLTK